MVALPNPARAALVAAFDREIVLAEVLITRHEHGFDLRHHLDRAPAEALRELSISDLGPLAQTTTAGRFRPNKAAPNLQRGWHAMARSEDDLEAALCHLYPGALADWFAGRQPAPPVTHFREFVNRQTGLYRVPQLLSDELATRTISAGCAARFCLRDRRWTVAGLAPDDSGSKSLIPCLEPCALLLDLARRAQLLAQGEPVKIALAAADLDSLLHALDVALEQTAGEVREGDTGASQNPRRLALVREHLRSLKPPSPTPAG